MYSNAITAKSDLFAPIPASGNDLAARLARGEEDAFTMVIAHYDVPLLRLTAMLTGNREDGRDAAQEAFLRLYKYRHRLREDEDIRPWLYRLAVNAARDVARKRLRTEDLQTRFAAIQASAEPAHAQGGDYDSERLQLLHQGLATLSPREREVIVLRDVEGLPATEAARILKLKSGTVRALTHRGRSKLQRFVAHAKRKDL